MVCWTAMDTADQTKSRETLQDKEFNRSISSDHYGNTRGKFFLNNNEHDIQFNRQSRSHRNVTPEESLQNIKKLEKIQIDVLQNAEENMRSLVAKEKSCFYMWSSLDLEDKSSIVQSKEKLKPLLKACIRYFHQIVIFSPNDSPSKTMKNAYFI